MFEKILQKLKTQRGATSMVSDRSLEDLARSLETVITTDDLLNKADFTTAIKSLEGNINHQIAERVKAVEELKKKADDDASKKKADEEAKKQKKVEGKVDDEPPAWAQQLLENNKKLSDEILAIKNGKVTESRVETLKKTLEGMPDYYTKPILAGFSRLSFTDDTQFTDYVKEVQTNSVAFVQTAKENGLNIAAPAKDVQKPVETGETGILAEARKLTELKKQQQTKTE